LEEFVETDEYKNDFIESYVQIGYQIGFKQGIQEGIEQVRVAVKTKSVLKLLDGFGLNPTDAQRARVVACRDLAQLDLWFDRALTAKTAADVFED
jgi:hypothetical protein